ncbi:MAG: hypothetical protein K8I30_07630 [Anaerolineae bacterium]|nr:hypothetical protein [Anaerolineae bacterium]
MKLRRAFINFLTITGVIAAYGVLCWCSTTLGPSLFVPDQDMGQSGLGAFGVGFIISTVVIVAFGVIAAIMYFLLTRIYPDK